MKLFNSLFLIICLVSALILSGCGNSDEKDASTTVIPIDLNKGERSGKEPVVSQETRSVVNAILEEKTLAVTGKAKIAILYHLDRPAHREAVLSWLKSHSAKLNYESKKMGYLDAELSWKNLGKLVKTKGKLGLDQTSLMKIEIENVKMVQSKKKSKLEAFLKSDNTSFTGPVHSAGYGTRLKEFREVTKKEFNRSSDLEGEGTIVAVYDSGIDLSRTDIFHDRLIDIIIGDDKAWLVAKENIQAYMKRRSVDKAPKGLEDHASLKELKLITINEKTFGFDMNGSGSKGDEIDIAIYNNKENLPELRVKVSKELPFGKPIMDIGTAHKKRMPNIINLFNGQYYKREGFRPSTSAMGVKFKKDGGVLKFAIVGTSEGAGHGTANMHMVGGDYTDASGKVSYKGVAPKTKFIFVQTWTPRLGNYGSEWIPLARTMIDAAAMKADVIDLDIYTPGTRLGNDLLSSLACRITARTKSIPIAASHNFGPLSNTIQSMAQSPCILGIGASVTTDAATTGYGRGHPYPGDNEGRKLKTAMYSGRGFGLNGMLKPDIISPAYAYTAYGEHFIRFGGTSGATPATAGLIVLLREAAKLAGTDFDFTQLKMLLQNSSFKIAPDKIREGYGFLNLEKAWELVKELKGKSVPFKLSGNKNLQFRGMPKKRRYSIKLTHDVVKGSPNSVVPMKFFVEYAGASSTIGKKWLKIVDSRDTSLADKLQIDIPIHGESTNLTLFIDLDDREFANLSTGDHIALVKGYRTDLPGESIEFVQPVSLIKPMKFNNLTLKTKGLNYFDYQNFHFDVSKGDSVVLWGRSYCDSSLYTSDPRSNTPTGLKLLVRNLPKYSHASEVMNTYSPMTIQPSPITIEAKGAVDISVGRYSPLECKGEMSSELHLKRVGFNTTESDWGYEKKDGKHKMSKELLLEATGSFSPQNTRYESWKFEAGSTKVLLKGVFTKKFKMVLGSDVTNVTVRPLAKKQLLHGILANVKVDGEKTSIIKISKGVAESADYNGLDYADPKITLASAKKGTTLLFVPATDESFVVELELKRPVQASLKGSFTSVGAKIDARLSFEDSWKLELEKLFPGAKWKKSIVLPYVLNQKSESSSFSGIGGNVVKFWQSRVVFKLY